jgi:hypothetical protein
MSYAWEKFFKAVNYLVAPGSIQERLFNAYCYELSLVKDPELPEEIRDDFRKLRRTLTKGPVEDEAKGLVYSAVNRMSDNEADDIARSIVSMFNVIAHKEKRM